MADRQLPQEDSASGRPDSAGAIPRPATPSESLAGIGLAFACFFFVTPLLRNAALDAFYVAFASGASPAEFRSAADQYESPFGMAASGIAIASMLPICAILLRTLHQSSLAVLSPTTGRLRWGWLAAYTMAGAITIVGGSVGLGVLRGDPPIPTGPVAEQWSFLAVIVLVTPLQSAAEEYLFRGYLMYAMRNLTPSPWLSAVVTSLVFASLHGAQDLPLFLNRFAFGYLASTLVIVTGGMEASIAAHVCNNVGAYTIATLTGKLAQMRSAQSLPWADALLDVALFAVFAAGAILLSRARTHTRQEAPR